ncbi:unnamed protein product [Ostreobium quekettii]|uniref:Magnesium-dependent phosphatase-1 n=1 Tax=Ostreobium quekettii TaxID=121088 RepID=A0A8S1INI5_9CHLO|nr:unnamed protein product [Ostreobium quekettii]|eukprot:evm.model.scf_7.11 EVM.evm.TU.scf_7.11   scf_7:90326-93971(+)
MSDGGLDSPFAHGSLRARRGHSCVDKRRSAATPEAGYPDLRHNPDTFCPQDELPGGIGMAIGDPPLEWCSEALEALRRCSPPPGMVVFDLDYCTWPFWCEMYTVSDTPRLYPEAGDIIEAIKDSGVAFGVASRTPTPHVARAFLNRLGLTEKIDFLQLIPAADGFDQRSAQKDTAHFPNLKRDSGLPYSDMLFFDDEHKNVAKGGWAFWSVPSLQPRFGTRQNVNRQHPPQG